MRNTGFWARWAGAAALAAMLMAGTLSAAQSRHLDVAGQPQIGVQATTFGTRTTVGVGQHRFGRGGVVIIPDGRVLPFERGVDRPSVRRIQPDIRVFRFQGPTRRDRGSGHPVYRFYYGD